MGAMPVHPAKMATGATGPSLSQALAKMATDTFVFIGVGTHQDITQSPERLHKAPGDYTKP